MTSEWSQRSGLTTFTLVPSRGRVIAAKAVAALIVGIVSMLVAFAIGAIGTAAGSAIAGSTRCGTSDSPTPPRSSWQPRGMAIGFALGLCCATRRPPSSATSCSPSSLSGILVLLAQVRESFTDLQPWVDWNFTRSLFDGRTSLGPGVGAGSVRPASSGSSSRLLLSAWPCCAA